MNQTEERIQKAVTEAEEAFWAAIRNRFPEATTGDLQPEIVCRLNEFNLAAVRLWLKNNTEHKTHTLSCGCIVAENFCDMWMKEPCNQHGGASDVITTEDFTTFPV